MKINKIAERLKNYKKIEKATISLQRKLNELENSCYPKTVSFEQRVTTSKVNNTEKRLIDNIKKKDDIIDQIVALTEERLAVLDLINKLSEDKEWLAITKLYVLNQDVSIVCKDLRLSKSQLYRVRKKALENLEATSESPPGQKI